MIENRVAEMNNALQDHLIGKGGATTDDVARNQEIHSRQVEKLVYDMRNNSAELRAQLRTTQSMIVDISETERSLQATVDDSHAEISAVGTFREEMEGDFKLMEQKPVWEAAVSDFLSGLCLPPRRRRTQHAQPAACPSRLWLLVADVDTCSARVRCSSPVWCGDGGSLAWSKQGRCHQHAVALCLPWRVPRQGRRGRDAAGSRGGDLASRPWRKGDAEGLLRG